jgi:hypothetical protein
MPKIHPAAMVEALSPDHQTRLVDEHAVRPVKAHEPVRPCVSMVLAAKDASRIFRHVASKELVRVSHGRGLHILLNQRR